MLDSLPYRIQTDLPPKDIQLAADCRRSRDKRLPASLTLALPRRFVRLLFSSKQKKFHKLVAITDYFQYYNRTGQTSLLEL
jgi:hypothetical protein